MIKKITVVSEKYNGELRDTYEAILLDHIGTMLRLKVPADTPIYEAKHGRRIPSEDTATEIYFTDRWYNVYHLREHTTYPNLWYSNVAMPASFDGLTLRWVDLDLDIRCYLDGTIRVLDEQEFRENRVLMEYPEEVVDHALAARNEILLLAKGGAFPFDHKVQISDNVLER